jgi:hypothetical protein
MAGNNYDPNPGKYLVVYGGDPKFLQSLRELEGVDTSIGNVNSPISNSAMVRYLNVLLTQREEEIQDRILLIQERDKELQRLIGEIHRIYSSKRYRVGHFIIFPIESVIKLLRNSK